jgi:hypothetical protein
LIDAAGKGSPGGVGGQASVIPGGGDEHQGKADVAPVRSIEADDPARVAVGRRLDGSKEGAGAKLLLDEPVGGSGGGGGDAVIGFALGGEVVVEQDEKCK